tara:strand:- start:39 stop:287 length:249 start_codon:yes stop_codon:yes gene_type:complete
MPSKRPFHNEDFNKKLDSATKKIAEYLNEKEFQLTDLTFEELIQWNDVSANGPRLIYPHEDCPSKIKNIIQNFINEEFKKTE